MEEYAVSESGKHDLPPPPADQKEFYENIVKVFKSPESLMPELMEPSEREEIKQMIASERDVYDADNQFENFRKKMTEVRALADSETNPARKAKLESALADAALMDDAAKLNLYNAYTKALKRFETAETSPQTSLPEEKATQDLGPVKNPEPKIEKALDAYHTIPKAPEKLPERDINDVIEVLEKNDQLLNQIESAILRKKINEQSGGKADEIMSSDRLKNAIIDARVTSDIRQQLPGIMRAINKELQDENIDDAKADKLADELLATMKLQEETAKAESDPKAEQNMRELVGNVRELHIQPLDTQRASSIMQLLLADKRFGATLQNADEKDPERKPRTNEQAQLDNFRERILSLNPADFPEPLQARIRAEQIDLREGKTADVTPIEPPKPEMSDEELFGGIQSAA